MKNLLAKFLIPLFSISILLSHQSSISMDLKSLNNKFTGGSAMVILVELIQNELKSKDPQMRIRAIKTILLIAAAYIGFFIIDKLSEYDSYDKIEKNDAVAKNLLTLISMLSKVAILALHRSEHEDIVGKNAVKKHIKLRRSMGVQDNDDSYPEAEENPLIPNNPEATYQTFETKTDTKDKNNSSKLEVVPHSPESEPEQMV